MGHSMSLEVIAEGVERAEQFRFLRTIGCDFVQGYYFHRPLRAQDVPPLLRRPPSSRDQEPFPEALPASA